MIIVHKICSKIFDKAENKLSDARSANCLWGLREWLKYYTYKSVVCVLCHR